jgi:hypothetical protein
MSGNSNITVTKKNKKSSRRCWNDKGTMGMVHYQQPFVFPGKVVQNCTQKS